MEEYIIHVTKTGWDGLDGTWFVAFAFANTPVHNKLITFCAIRKESGEFFVPRAGCSVQNPKDADDLLRGKRTAFKRAVEVIADEPLVLARFRGALWLAMGRPGYTKSKILSDLHKGLNFKLVTPGDRLNG